MKKNDKRVLCFSVAVLSALILAGPSGLQAAPQQTPTEPQVLTNAVANQPIHFDVSPSLVELASKAGSPQTVRSTHKPRQPKLEKFNAAGHQRVPRVSGARSMSSDPLISATIGLGFEGVGNTSVLNCPSVAGITVVPPDTNAAVGDTQVVEWVNVCYAVFDKFTGALIKGPISGDAFWAGFGGGCEADNDGDIIIQWDKSNHRWLASQNDFGPNFTGPYQTCIAVSQTADATGSYFRYAFPQPGFPDYPKWGLTSSVYYQTQNNFGLDDGFQGVTVCGYDADLMLKGSSKATQVCIVDNSNGTLFDDSMLPADDDSDHGPAKSEVLMGAIDNFLPGDTHVYEYLFDVNFGNPSKSTLAGVDGSMPISVPAFDLAFCTNPSLTTYCVPQPSPGSELLDTLGDRLMYRLAHFNEHGTQHFLVTHSVNNTTAVAQRWYEFRSQGLGNVKKLSLYQSGETPDDGEYRWMGSVAMDQAGDIALGYSRSSAASGDYPSIYYSGQTAGDTPGTTETEALIKQGGGSQFNSFNRWGDYTSMALDGVDSCTFWYANEYYPVDGSFAWATWLASLKFPNCR
ncbi:MAG: hypothetical protein WCC03_21345 [Candidatus Acidiferrales bacterium]